MQNVVVPSTGIALQQGVIKLKLTKKQIAQKKAWQESGNARHYDKPYLRLYGMLCRRAKKADIPNNMTYSQFLTFTENETCHYCDAPLKWVKHGDSATAINIDRKDNNKGYSKKNCVAACTRCNMSRGNRFTYDEWVEMTKVIKRK